MVECIVNTLLKKFNINRDVAALFFYEIYNRRKVEHFIEHLEKFNSFEEMKKFYLGGN